MPEVQNFDHAFADELVLAGPQLFRSILTLFQIYQPNGGGARSSALTKVGFTL